MDPRLSDVRVSFSHMLLLSCDALAGVGPLILQASGRDADGEPEAHLVLETRAEVASVAVQRKDGGGDLALARTSLATRLSADLDSLPEEAAATLTLTDATGATIAEFEGSFTSSAGFSLSRVEGGDAGDCGGRAGCGAGGGRDLPAVTDIELLSAPVFEEGAGGFSLVFDLRGLDLDGLESARLCLLEDGASGDACPGGAEDDACLRGGPLGHGICIEISAGEGDETVALFESYGKPLHEWHEDFFVKAVEIVLDSGRRQREKVETPRLWEDRGAGAPALLAEIDPLTTVGLYPRLGGAYGFAIVSEGWSRDDALPEMASVALEDGGSWTIPVNSYQASGLLELDLAVEEGDPEAWVDIWVAGAREHSVRIGGGGGGGGPAVLETGPGGVILIDALSGEMMDDPDYDILQARIGVNVSGTTGARLPSSLELEWEDSAGHGGSTIVELGEEIAVVFAMELALDGNPLGYAFQGRLALMGPADRKGKRRTLLRDNVFGQLVLDADGEIGLGAPSREAALRRGDILIGGEPIGIERASGGAGTIRPPEVRLRTAGDGLQLISVQGATELWP